MDKRIWAKGAFLLLLQEHVLEWSAISDFFLALRIGQEQQISCKTFNLQTIITDKILNSTLFKLMTFTLIEKHQKSTSLWSH